MPTVSTSSNTTDPIAPLPTPNKPAVVPARHPPKMRAVHPGEILAEVLGNERLSVAGAARRLRVSRQTLHRIIKGDSAVTAEMALRLGKLCGNGPGLWLRLQATYDLAVSRRHLADELELIPGLDVAA